MTRSDNRKSFVIAITGASGAGKTVLVKEATALLDDAVSLYFDDYASTHQSPGDLADWFKRTA
jgi:uridine kinase